MFKESASLPKEIVLALSYQCNLRCQMCGIWKRKEKGCLEISDLKPLPHFLKDINLTGGEPLLRDDLPLIIEFFTIHCPKAKIVISSNGSLIDRLRDQATKIYQINSKVGWAISLDGSQEVHDKIRGVEGSFLRAIRSLKILKEIGFKNLKISFTLSDDNYQELKKVYNLAKDLGAEFSLTLVHSAENYFASKNSLNQKKFLVRELEWLIDKELASFNFKRWARAYYAFGMKQFILKGKRILPDYSGNFSVFIDPFGNVFPSDVSNQKIGTLKNWDKINFQQSFYLKPSWMICTARWSIKKHWFKTIRWILVNQFFRLFFSNHWIKENNELITENS